jgi:hypothetical protein
LRTRPAEQGPLCPRRGMRIAALAAGLSLIMLALPMAAHAKTVWLCRPGIRPDPCTPGLSTTVYRPNLETKIRVKDPRAEARPAIDCFYVYPTVSDQKTEHANLQIDPEERSIALYQAARYSQYCRVFAPMYRQVTVPYLDSAGGESAKTLALPFKDLRAAFDVFLKRYSDGRGFVLIGHSQGAFLLRELIARDIDPKAALRRRLVSAILMGGNVLVRRGSDVGGDFTHIPACRTRTELGCVTAFSTFDRPPPTDSLFGRSPNRHEAVLCTNPAQIDGSGDLLDPIFPSQPFAPGTLIAAGIALLNIQQPHPDTVWSTEADAYTAHCSTAGGVDVLEVRPRDGAPTPTPSPTPEWGLHLTDANIALGNLIDIVHHEALTYTARDAVRGAASVP